MIVWKRISNISAYSIGVWFIFFEFILDDNKYIFVETIGYVMFVTGFLFSELMKYLKKRKG